MQSEQLARAKGFGHVQHEQETVPPGSFRQNRPELLPGQNLLVLGPKVLGGPQLARRVFDQEFVLDGLVKDGLEIRSCLLDPVLRVPRRQTAHMRLQHESVERIERQIAELQRSENTSGI